MDYSNFIPDPPSRTVEMDNISPPPDALQLQSEIERLMDTNVILKTFPYVLIVCDLANKPALTQELGRQREITFRNVGESTGQAIDIDKYDAYYDQLIIWDEFAEKLVGGYRFGCGDKIFDKYGKDGFYINSFFRIDPAFDSYFPYCLELGRSFIVDSYQRKNLPLYLLWKGILAFQCKNTRYRWLIGPVSVSRFYSDHSRRLLMEYADRYLRHETFSQWFHPRVPFDPMTGEHEEEVKTGVAADFENMIDDIRPSHIQFPVLMKQYVRQNARFLGFNLDPDFNNALDGLMIVDMKDIPDRTIEMLQR